MEKAIQFGKILCFFSIALLLLVLSVVILPFRSIPKNVNATMVSTQGTLKLANKAINDLRLTLDNGNKAAIDERMYFEQVMPPSMSQVEKLLENSNKLLVSLKETSDGLDQSQKEISGNVNTLLGTAGTTVGQAQVLMESANKTVQDSDELVKNPAITASLVDIEKTAQNVSVATAAVSVTAQDIQGEVHRYTHPTVVTKIANWTIKSVTAAGNWFGVR